MVLDSQTFNSYYLDMFDTLKLIYTQDEALELVGRYEKVYNKKIEELEEENRKLENKILKLGTRIYQNIDGEKREEYQEYCKKHKL